MILVDTSAWIDWFRGGVKGVALKNLIDQKTSLAVTGLIVTELLQGARHETDRLAVERIISNYPLLSTKGLPTYRHAAELYQACRRQGQTPRKSIDCVIAAIAIERQCLLFHDDRDFDIIAQFNPLQIYRAPQDLPEPPPQIAERSPHYGHKRSGKQSPKSL